MSIVEFVADVICLVQFFVEDLFLLINEAFGLALVAPDLGCRDL